MTWPAGGQESGGAHVDIYKSSGVELAGVLQARER